MSGLVVQNLPIVEVALHDALARSITLLFALVEDGPLDRRRMRTVRWDGGAT